jgi:hypothetical protein
MRDEAREVTPSEAYFQPLRYRLGNLKRIAAASATRGHGSAPVPPFSLNAIIHDALPRFHHSLAGKGAFRFKPCGGYWPVPMVAQKFNTPRPALPIATSETSSPAGHFWPRLHRLTDYLAP